MKNNTHIKALMYAGTLFLLILSTAAIAATVMISKQNSSYDENTISVTGTAEVSTTPDIAQFSFTVREEVQDAAEGQKTLNKKISTILDGLKDLDVDEKDIKTDSYSIQPKYEWVKISKNQKKIALDGTEYFPGNDSQRVQTGYEVSQNITVKMRDFDNVPAALTLFAENDVDNLYGPNFQIDDPEKQKEEARLEAIKEAKEKAKRLAKDLDVKLGKIVSFNENSYNPQPYYGRAMMAKSVAFDVMEADFAPELPVGEEEISATVTITYIIK